MVYYSYKEMSAYNSYNIKDGLSFFLVYRLICIQMLCNRCHFLPSTYASMG